MTISILLVDDHSIFREGLRMLLEREPELRVVAEAADGDTAINLAEQLRPDVILLDMVMPGKNGLEVTRIIKKCSPKSQVIILSMHSDESYVLNAIKNGASGYVLKENSASEIIAAIQTTLTGKHYLCHPLCHQVIEAYVQMGKNQRSPDTRSLTAREQTIYRQMVNNKPIDEIASMLHLSRRSIEKYQMRLLAKLGFQNIDEMVQFAVSAKQNDPPLL